MNSNAETGQPVREVVGNADGEQQKKMDQKRAEKLRQQPKLE